MMTIGGGRGIITLRAADRDRGGGTWVMTDCCDNVQDLLTSINDLDKRIWMAYSGYEKRATCTLREIQMIMRATCHHEVCGTCSQEEGSLHNPHIQKPSPMVFLKSIIVGAQSSHMAVIQDNPGRNLYRIAKCSRMKAPVLSGYQGKGGATKGRIYLMQCELDWDLQHQAWKGNHEC
ncbi:hypothetical protein CK203_012643 [Vitis vinifera]|uniref:Uncharacterized protein n=1 Tax=Vitis vinifera TaxID=29760 RepID=A0A438KML6_VITVI|nr:hypothetical protein CK203_012643 [Vitis vinifera]